jgi:ABC-type sugar transport system substrate-binding protein
MLARTVKGRSLVTLLSVAALGAGLTACGSSNNSSTSASSSASTSASSSSTTTAKKGVKPRTIGYVDIFPSAGIQVRWHDMFKQATDALGWTVTFTDAKGIPATANQQATALLNGGKIDALVAAGVDTAAMRSSINLAHSKKIPILFLGTPVSDPSAWDGTYVEDEAAMGRALADYVKSQAGSAPQQQAIVYNTELIAGTLRASSYEGELKGTNIKVVAKRPVENANSVAGTRQIVSSFLSQYPKLNGIMLVFTNFAPSAVSALQSSGHNNVSLYSWYADRDNAPNLRKGSTPLKALVDGPVDQLALVIADQLVNHFEKGAPFKSAAPKFKYQVFTKDNVPPDKPGYVSPYPTDQFLQQYTTKWKSEFGI